MGFTEKDFRENGVIEKNVRCIYIGALEEKNYELKSICIAFMKKRLSNENCFQFLEFASKYKCNDLKQAVCCYILQCLDVLANHVAFLNMTFDQINSIVTLENSTVTEDDSTEALNPSLLPSIIGWVKYDTDLRQKYLYPLIKNLKLLTLDSNILRQSFWEDEFVKSQKDCCTLYLETIHIKHFTDMQCNSAKNGDPKIPVPSFSGKFRNDNGAEKAPPADNSASGGKSEKGKVTSPAQSSPSGSSSSKNLTRKRNCKYHYDSSADDEDEAEAYKVNVAIGKTEAFVTTMERVKKQKLETPLKSDKTSRLQDETGSINYQPVPSSTQFHNQSVENVSLHERSIAYFLCGDRQKVIMSYNVETRGPPKEVANFAFRLAEVSLVYHSGHIYCIGGCDIQSPKSAVKLVYRFNLKTNKWATCRPMLEERCHFQPTVLHGVIYAVAGCDGRLIMNCVEKLDPGSRGSGSWKECDYPNNARADCGTATVGDRIYTVGGLWPRESVFVNDSDNSVSDVEKSDVYVGVAATKSVEAYDPVSDNWSAKSSLPIPLIGPSVVAHEARQCMYAFGGSKKPGSNRLNRAFVYHPEDDEWQELHHMCQARRFASSIVLGDFIYVIGGNEGELPTMERYDIADDSWKLIRNCNLPRNGIYRSVAFASDNFSS